MRKLNKKVWPYQVQVKSENDGDIDQWCKDNIGIRFRQWYGYMYKDRRMYAFTDEGTLLVFKLRWGNYVSQAV
jgi:hypothetical protein